MWVRGQDLFYLISHLNKTLICLGSMPIQSWNQENKPRGLPWWCSGWESTWHCRGHGFEPWSGRIPHAAEQLSPCATATEPALWSPRATTTELACHNYWAREPRLLRPARLEPVLRNKRSHRSERPAHHNKEWPPLAATRESPLTAARTQHSQK